MSDVREAMWGVLQRAVSDLDFDYGAYARRALRAPARRRPPTPGWRTGSVPRPRELPEPRARRHHRRRRRRHEHRLPPRAARRARRRARRPQRADERLDVPLRGPRRPAALERLADEDDDVQRRALPAAARPSPSSTPAGSECGGIRLACTPEREQEIHRQVAWAQDVRAAARADLAAGGAGALPADGHRRRARRARTCRPTATSIPRSSPTRWPTARAAAACRSSRTRASRASTSRTARSRGVRTEWGDIECEVVVNAGGMYAAEIGRLAGVRVPIIPFAHEYLVTQPFAAMQEARARRRGHLPTLRDPDLLVYYREEGGGLVMGGYERDSAPWSLDERLVDRIPPTFNGQLLEEDWDRFEEITENSQRRVPVDGRPDGHEAHQRARGVHARQRVLPRRDRGARLLRRRRLLRARARRRGRHRQGDGRVDPQPASRRWTSGTWTCGASGPQYRSPSYTLKRAKEVYETYYDIRYPGHERLAGRPLRVSSAYAVARRARRGVRREVRLGARQLVRVQRARPATRRCARAAGRACTGRRRSAPSTAPRARRAGAVRRVLVRQARDLRARAPRRSSSACATTASRAASGRSPTRRCSTRAAGSSATSPSRGSREDRFSIVTGTAFGQHDAAWLRRTRRATAASRSTT